MPRGRPPNTIICLVGSTKFTREMMIRSWELSKQNCIVLGWNVLPHDMCVDSHGAEAEGVKEQIDELHKRKIDMCDEVHVINISGYIGESTRSEIEYALDLRKRVKFLFAAPIMCRKEIGPAIHPRLGLGSPLCGRMQGHNGRCNPVIPVGMEYAPTPDASEPCKQPIGNTTCGYPESACMHTGSKDTIIPLNGRHDYKP